jgi:Leucine-rich repeat (LRR) protein
VGRIYAVKDDVDFSQRKIGLKNIGTAQGLFERPKGQVLSLELNYAGGMDLSFLKNLQANDLIGIDNDDIAIDCSTLAALQHLTELKRLILRNSDFSDKECACLKNLPLEYMDISKTLITGTGLSVCKTLTHLKMLVLSYNSLDSTAAAALAGIPKLEQLHLTSTNIGDSDLANIAKIKTLTHLKVADNKKITDRGIASLAVLPNLRMVDASGTSVSINCLNSLKKMHSLRSLTISSPRISTSEFFQIAHQLPNCRVDDSKKSRIPPELFSPLH